MFVIDASVAASWAFPDEEERAAQSAFHLLATQAAVAPALFWYELRNVLLVAERCRRISPMQTAGFLNLLAGLPIEMDRDPHEGAMLGLARAHNLTIYDAAYLELAQRKSLPLATLNAALAKAARTEHVLLLGD